jgi:hypothetical protein
LKEIGEHCITGFTGKTNFAFGIIGKAHELRNEWIEE